MKIKVILFRNQGIKERLSVKKVFTKILKWLNFAINLPKLKKSRRNNKNFSSKTNFVSSMQSCMPKIFINNLAKKSKLDKLNNQLHQITVINREGQQYT